MQVREKKEVLLLSLCQQLTTELAGIFDAHGVCAAAASEIGQLTGATTLIALSEPFYKHYDVWVCERGGQLSQTRWDAGRVALAQLIAVGEAAVIHRADLNHSQTGSGETWPLAFDTFDSIVFIPLPYPLQPESVCPPGALCLLDTGTGINLTLNEFRLVATQLTTYLERAYLRQRIDRQEVEFAIISDISSSVTATLNLEEIFHQVADQVRRTVNAQSISIGLIEDSGEIVFVQSLMGPLFQSLPPVRLKPNQGIAGWVASHGEPLIVNNVYDDARFYTKADEVSGFQTQSILCIPLQVEQRVIGVLEVINKQKGPFNEADQQLLQAIGGPLAAAIENARLHAYVLAEKRRIETIFASMSEGMLTVNREGVITAVNESLLTLLRKRAVEEVEWRPILEVIKTNSGHFEDFLAEVFEAAGESPQLACDLYQGDDEYVPVLASGAPIEGEDGRSEEAIIVFSDLRQIREVERMRDDFFHNIVHELRTPLATILMYARVLREGKTGGDKAKADRFLGVIERESDRLQRMVRQMLQLAKLEAREIQRSSERVSLRGLLEEMLPSLADQALEKGLTFSQRIPDDAMDVVGNQETLYMIFKNLVENAIKFTPAGKVYIGAARDNSVIAVEVRDDGIGIPSQAMPNLFKRFYRAQTAVERGIAGTGLGLYMVKEGVEKHAGTIQVSSAEGQGTTFVVRLPVAPN